MFADYLNFIGAESAATVRQALNSGHEIVVRDSHKSVHGLLTGYYTRNDRQVLFELTTEKGVVVFGLGSVAIDLQDGLSDAYRSMLTLTSKGFDFNALRTNPSYSENLMTWLSIGRGELGELTAAEKKSLFDKIQAADPTWQNVPPVLRVFFNPSDAQAWIEIFEYTTDHETVMQATAKDVSLSARHMPEQTREFLLDRIAEKYPSAGKSPLNAFAQAPKRALDIWLRILAPAEETFDVAFRKSGNALLAYQAYFDWINSRIISRMHSNSQNYGHMTAEDILEIAKAASAALHENKSYNPNARIRLHGSLEKGLAKTGSDIDALIAGMNAQDYGAFPSATRMEGVTISGGPAAAMLKVLRKRRPEMQLLASVPHEEKKGLGSGVFEPFMIEITSNAVYLLVKSGRDHLGRLNTHIPEEDCDAGINCQRYLLSGH